MKNSKLVAFALGLSVMSGCSVRTGLLVDVADVEKPLMGEAVASLSSGRFTVSNMDGYVCEGTYDQFTQSPMLQTDVSCSDGRHGKVMVMRTGPNLINGSGEGVLDDGTKFKVLMGEAIHHRDSQGIWEKVKTDD